MSKVIKQMEMTSLKNTFQDVRDLVVLSIKDMFLPLLVFTSMKFMRL